MKKYILIIIVVSVLSLIYTYFKLDEIKSIDKAINISTRAVDRDMRVDKRSNYTKRVLNTVYNQLKSINAKSVKSSIVIAAVYSRYYDTNEVVLEIISYKPDFDSIRVVGADGMIFNDINLQSIHTDRINNYNPDEEGVLFGMTFNINENGKMKDISLEQVKNMKIALRKNGIEITDRVPIITPTEMEAEELDKMNESK